MNLSSSLSLFPKHGYYYVQYIDDDGRRRQKSLRTKKKTEAIRLVADLDRVLKEKPKPILFSKFTKEFLIHRTGFLSSKTLELYERSFNSFLKIVGDRALTRITPKEWDIFASKQVQNHYQPVTVNIQLRCLRASMETAVRWKYLVTNPFSGQTNVPVDDKPPSYFTLKQFQKLHSLVDGWMNDFLLLAVSTGMRLNEMRCLRWVNIDFDRRFLTIAGHDNFQTKTHRMRSIPMNDVAYKVLMKRREISPEGEYVFYNKDTGKPLNKNAIARKIKRWIKKAGLPESLHTHSLRHTTASWLVQSGIPIYDVQQILGHSSVRQTAIYSHLQPEHLRKAMDKLTVGLI